MCGIMLCRFERGSCLLWGGKRTGHTQVIPAARQGMIQRLECNTSEDCYRDYQGTGIFRMISITWSTLMKIAGGAKCPWWLFVAQEVSPEQEAAHQSGSSAHQAAASRRPLVNAQLNITREVALIVSFVLMFLLLSMRVRDVPTDISGAGCLGLEFMFHVEERSSAILRSRLGTVKRFSPVQRELCGVGAGALCPLERREKLEQPPHSSFASCHPAIDHDCRTESSQSSEIDPQTLDALAGCTIRGRLR